LYCDNTMRQLAGHGATGEPAARGMNTLRRTGWVRPYRYTVSAVGPAAGGVFYVFFVRTPFNLSSRSVPIGNGIAEPMSMRCCW